jgi:sucrose-6-phosphate hydrolase SacC (GH32 family)
MGDEWSMKSKFFALLVLMIFTISIYPMPLTFAATYPEFPYSSTNYDELYRGQFHFSPQGGWMNDVNGIWYYKGVYHMTFQHYPHGLNWAQMHWGHATSTDMIHWVQQPIALEPDTDPNGNVPGDCYSGSVVVDTNNTSGFKTGTEDVFVAIYTATNRGTCLAYSNDQGATWQAYSGNPVNIGGPNADTRDPHVFWYAPTSKWVCVEYENGMTFYTSSNLKSWTKASNFSWGFECPDFFELAVDGGSTKKWVLMDASTSYYIGSFNGTTFTPDPGGPYKMDNCGDFYASQTFFRNNFPDNRVIQMGWMRGFATGTAPTWTHNASFPSELKLITLPQGVRVTRTPIAEISQLYGMTQTWGAQTLTSSNNLLSGVNSKCFDLAAEFDLTNATATKINFNLPGQTVTYDISNKTLYGQTLNPVNNHIKLRLLVDWGELEIFGNDGALSYSHNVTFTPQDSFLGLSVNGNVNLVSMTYHDVNRTWPGIVNSPGMTIDDGAAEVTYSGTWNSVTNDPIYLNNTCHVGNTTNGYFQYTFTGTKVEWFGLKNNDLGKADVYIDGVLDTGGIDCYSANRAVNLLFSKNNLPFGSHTIKVVVTGTKNTASSNTYLVHDYFAYSTEPAKVDDTAAGMTYSGTWNSVTNDSTYYNNTCHAGNTTNGYFQYTFTGTQVEWYGLKNADLGKADVYIDGTLVTGGIDCYSTTRAVNRLFGINNLLYGSHTIKVVVTGTKNAASSNTYLVHDYFTYATEPARIDDAVSGVTYSGTWNSASDQIYLNGTCHYGNTTNGYFQYIFTGTQVEWYGLRNNDLGMADVYIDSVLKSDNIDCYSTTRAVQKLFSISGLTNGSHTIKVVVTGAKNASSANTYLVHDYFVVPVGFNDNFNDNVKGSAWSFYGGTWNETGAILRQDSTSQGDPCKAIISNTGINFGASHTILAKVYVNSWTDGDTARVGVGLFTGTGNGQGYNLIFHNNHSTVQFLDDGSAWGPSYTFNWTNQTWYWFKLQMSNGTLSGKVWQDGTTEPGNWPYTWARSGRSGYPALNGGTSGHGGSCTVFFDDVTVTVP